MTSFIVLVAILCVTVNMAHRVAATDTANTDEEYEDDYASQEDQHHNLTHFLRHHNHSTSATPTPEETDDDYPDEEVDVGFGNPNLAFRLPEESIQTSPDVLSRFSTPETPLQTLTSTVNQVGWLDISQVAEPLEEVSERSEIEGVPESSTVFGFRNRLEASYSGSVISVYVSSGFETPETVISGNVASNAAGIVASARARNVLSTPAGTVASTPVGTVASTRVRNVSSTSVGTVASTRARTVSSTPVGTVASTSLGTVASTPAGTVASTLVGTVASTRVRTVASTRVETVASTRVRTVASSRVRTVASTPARTVASTSVRTAASTPVETVASTPVETVAYTPAVIVASTPATVESTSSPTLYNSFLSSPHESILYMTRSPEAHQGLPTTSGFDHSQTETLSFHDTTDSHRASSELRLGGSIIHDPQTSSFHQSIFFGSTLMATPALEAGTVYFASELVHGYVTESSPARYESFHSVNQSSFAVATTAIRTTHTGPAEPRATGHAEAITSEHVESTATEHVESTATGHVESTATGHVESTATGHVESTATEHVESTATGHVESTATGHAESTATGHVESTATGHVESTATGHAESTATGHAESTATGHVESTATGHVESTAIKHPESITNVQDESFSTLIETWNFPTRASLQDSSHTPPETSIEFHAGLPSYVALISADIRSDFISAAPTTSSFVLLPSSDSATFLTRDSSQAEASAQRESFTAISSHECSICSSFGRSLEDIASTTVYTPESSAFPGAEMSGTSFPHTYSHMDAESLSAVSVFHTSWHLDGSEGQLTSTLFSQPSIPQSIFSRRDIRISSTEHTAAATPLHQATEDRIPSSYSFQDTLHSYTTSLHAASEDRIPSSSSFQDTLHSYTTSLHEATEDRIPSSSSFQDTLHPYTTSFHEATEDRISSSSSFQDTLHPYTTSFHEATEDRISSSFSFQDTLHSYTTSLHEATEDGISSSSSFQDTLHSYTTPLHQATEDRISSSSSFQDTPHSYTTSSLYSSLHLTPATGPSIDAVLHTEELRSSRYETPSVSDTFLTSVQDTPSRREAVDTSAYRVHDLSDVATSIGYDRIHTAGVIDTATHESRHALGENNTSRYHLLYSTEDETIASIYETLHINGSLTASSTGFSSHLLMHVSVTPGGYLETSAESELRPSVYSAGSVPVSAASILTTLLFTASLSTPRDFEADAISVFNQWESGGGSVGVATLSSTFTPTMTTEEALTLGQSSSVTPSATTDIGTEQIFSILTRPVLETSFDIASSIWQSPTSMHKDLSTLTTSLSTITTTTTTIENTTTLATTEEHTTPHVKTSTDLVPTVTSNFTIAIYFYGDCEKASQNKYRGIFNAKMLQFIRNASQLDDKSILIGHIQCKPNHIPVSFFQADRTLVFLYLNDTFSASPRYLLFHSMVLNLTGYSEEFDASKRNGENEMTTSDITIFATAACICLVLIIAGLAIFAKEIYHKKFSSRLSCPGSLGIHLKSEVVALRSFPANMSDYKHAEMNEAAFVNEAYSNRSEDEQSSVVSEMKTAFPSSECNSPEETRNATSSKAPVENNAGNATKPAVASSVSLSNGTNSQEPPGYGLIIGLMGYTRRLERQQQRKEHQKQQQKLHFEESSYYAVPQKRSKIAKNEDNTKTNASPTPASYSPASRPVTIEDSPVPPPRHLKLKTLHEVNELYESNEELVPFTGPTGADKPENAISQTDTGLDNPSFLEERGRVDSCDVFHF